MEDTDPVLLEKTLERRTSGKPRLSPYSMIGIATVPKMRSSRLPSGPGGKNQKKSYALKD
jgi:hypothetical protein